jgi:dTDP-4-amino-4,6-dideoxygalactose transaminase
VLTATKGSHTKRLEASLSELLGIEHVIACASGSAAVHVAVAGLDPEPGDEIITTSWPTTPARPTSSPGST